ncbi:MAG: hypothetical protein QUS35_11280 [bacterium]|nr:hypothetical protein [bacterium]
MHKPIFIKLLSVLVILAVVAPVHAGEVEDFVSKYTGENGEGYMQPLADAFGASLNSGLYHDARISRVRIRLYVGMEAMMATVGPDQKTFKAKTENFSPEQTVEAPTLFGKNEPVTVTGTGGTVYTFPGGMNFKRLPIAVPQATIGGIAGTDLTVRWFATSSAKDLGDIKLMGWGVRHSLSQYMPLLPLVDIAAGYYSQSFKVGDIVDAKATLISLQASVTKTVLVVYGGVGFESSKLDVAYEHNEAGSEPVKIGFELEGKNKMRMTVGAGLNLPGINIHGEYNIGTQSVLSAGFGFRF